jgi:hypothetical protein
MDADVKSELLEAAQHELMKHHWDTFCTEPLSIGRLHYFAVKLAINPDKPHTLALRAACVLMLLIARNLGVATGSKNCWWHAEHLDFQFAFNQINSSTAV